MEYAVIVHKSICHLSTLFHIEKRVLVLLNLSRLDTMGWWKSNDIKLNKLLRYVDEDINLANPLSNLAYIAVGDGTIDTIMYIESPPTENINYLRDVRGLK